MKTMSIINQLKRHEGFRSKPYLDTVGKLTIGFGRNLDDVGISMYEAERLLKNDVTKVRERLIKELPIFLELSPVRQAVLENMAFNMGLDGLKRFKKMIAAVNASDYKRAANEMLDSKWAQQVGNRAIELAEQMRFDEWQLNEQ